MPHAKRNGSANGHSLKIAEVEPKDQLSPKVSTFRDKLLKIFECLGQAGIEDELAWHYARVIAQESMRQDVNCPIESRANGSYDGNLMSGTATKSRNGRAKAGVPSLQLKPGVGKFRRLEILPGDDFEFVVSRGVLRFLLKNEISVPEAAKKYGLPEKGLYNLIRKPTPGLAGTQIDKVSRAFGITRQYLEDLGTPP